MGSSQKPATTKSPSSSIDEELGELPAKPKSPSILSTGLSRAIVISTVVFVAAIVTPLVVMHRYALAPGSRGEMPVVYRLDTLTGKVAFCTPTQCSPVPAKSDEGN